jgi:hypothetical protein
MDDEVSLSLFSKVTSAQARQREACFAGQQGSNVHAQAARYEIQECVVTGHLPPFSEEPYLFIHTHPRFLTTQPVILSLKHAAAPSDAGHSSTPLLPQLQRLEPRSQG